MLDLGILGVTPISDLYPNVKYKIDHISNLDNIHPHKFIYDLGKTSIYGDIATKGPLRKLLNLLRYSWGHIKVFFLFISKPCSRVYICYPGIFLTILLGILPRKIRPVIFLDTFISIYDTAIVDRKMYPVDSWISRCLYKIEKTAFSMADHILTDTHENSTYYSNLFNITVDKFVDIPLSITLENHEEMKPEITQKESQPTFVCLFIGSLVPLHGIRMILEAARELQDVEAIKFRIIGDGQESHVIEDYLQNYHLPNLEWQRGFYPTDYLFTEIQQSDVCLGIFGDTPKADRVFPYKLYYYCMLNKAFISKATACLTRYNETCHGGLLLTNSEEPKTLSKLIKALYKEPEKLRKYNATSRQLYETHLSNEIIEGKLSALLYSGVEF